MNIHHNLEAIIDVAKHYAKEHDTNYNVILHSPVNGEFGVGSTYEYVTDSYFEKERNCIILHKTDDLLANELVAVQQEDPFDIMPQYTVSQRYFDDIDNEMRKYGVETFHRGEPYIREDKKIGRNEPCPCGSGLKYKRCCLN
jgi:hypothetical protein